jgi:lysophospholipase L1-like esterase
MRNLFVLGDSISIQYGPDLARFVAARWDYQRKQGAEDVEAEAAGFLSGANGGDSDRVLAYLRHRLADDAFQPDLLLLNCGLHDLKLPFDSEQRQVPLDRYGENLRELLALVTPRCRLVGPRTPPGDGALHARRKDFRRLATDVEAYNAVADELMIAAGIPRIDLYGFSASFGPDATTDGVHFREDLRPLQAAFIAGALDVL